MNSPRRSTICVKTSGDTRQSLNISSRRCAHAGVIFSPPHLGLSRGHIGWRRLIQQEVTGCNEGQKMRDSKYTAALDTAIDVLDPEPPLIESLVGELLLQAQ